MGGIPLKYNGEQYLLFHNTNFIDSAKVRSVKNYFVFQILKKYISYADKILVQSPVVRDLLVKKLSIERDKVVALTMPSPKIPEFLNSKSLHKGFLNLIYPADYYIHKNFSLISRILKNLSSNTKFCLYLTTKNLQFEINENNAGGIIYLGKLDRVELFNYFTAIDALFFPSLKESLGIPLIEAMKLGKVIICSDLPYARWLCGDQAIYFDPNSPREALSAISLAEMKIGKGWKPDWSQALSKLTSDWRRYLELFMK